MRQPLSIYARSARLQSSHFAGRVKNKLLKIAGRKNEKPPKRQRRPQIGLDELRKAVTDLGLRRGDRVLVHSGISNIGRVRERAPAVVGMLRELIGENGLLLFPVFPFESLMYHYLSSNPTFDTKRSPTKMGALTTVALMDPDRARSIHPTHSVAGFGADAKGFLDGHHLDETPFGEHSPFWRLADAGGKILVLGVGLSSVTNFHLTEDRLGDDFPVRVYLDEKFTVPCKDDEEREFAVTTSCHDPAVSLVRDCYLTEPVFMEQGLYQKKSIGNHYVGLIDAKRMDTCLQNLARNRKFTIYGRIWG